MLPKQRSRLFWSLFGFALLFAVLGLGNIIVGNNRTEVYTRMLRQAQHKAIASSRAGIPEDRTQPVATLAAVQRVKGRLDFYTIVVAGGKCFLVVAGLLLLTCLAVLQVPKSAERRRG